MSPLYQHFRRDHPQRLRGRRGAADGLGPRVRRHGEAGRGRVPPDDEVQLRQLPRELDPRAS